jgi:hypothetical protein
MNCVWVVEVLDKNNEWQVGVVWATREEARESARYNNFVYKEIEYGYKCRVKKYVPET